MKTAELTAETAFLVDLLARIDGLFLPIRHHETPTAAAAEILYRREAYQSRGIAIVGGGGQSDRAAYSALVGRLRAAGEISVVGKTRLYARLATAAESHLRPLCASVQLSEAWPLLELVAAHDRLGHRLVGEWDVLGTDPTAPIPAPTLWSISAAAAPLLAAGMLTSDSDSQGHVAFMLTTHGRLALQSGPPIEIPWHEIDATSFYTESVTACSELYTETINEVEEARNGWQPEGKAKRVCVPHLSCGLWADVKQTMQIKALRKLAAEQLKFN